MDDVTKMTDDQVRAEYHKSMPLSSAGVEFWRAELADRRQTKLTVAVVGLAVASVLLVVVDIVLRLTGH